MDLIEGLAAVNGHTEEIGPGGGGWNRRGGPRLLRAVNAECVDEAKDLELTLLQWSDVYCYL